MLWNANAAHTAAAPSPATTPSSQLGRESGPSLLRKQLHDGDVGERVEAEVEEVGERRHRGRLSAERLDRQEDVAERPRQETDPRVSGATVQDSCPGRERCR